MLELASSQEFLNRHWRSRSIHRNTLCHLCEGLYTGNVAVVVIWIYRVNVYISRARPCPGNLKFHLQETRNCRTHLRYNIDYVVRNCHNVSPGPNANPDTRGSTFISSPPIILFSPDFKLFLVYFGGNDSRLFYNFIVRETSNQGKILFQ